MTGNTQGGIRLAATVNLGEGLEIPAQVVQVAAWTGDASDRRHQRALRVQAMVALGQAWADPLLRQRWRSATGR